MFICPYCDKTKPPEELIKETSVCFACKGARFKVEIPFDDKEKEYA